ncbi:hypothetical protein EJ02DRAFT_180721 [Clathrospora elynae]|uniref:Uncharacterized protein n=1 Tax=Clathrospora elynae TaxID=706981 RepID=A0A6A5SU96_9PLEO|nr:hypothetical protein EJ02DRAFT_180721 [Clathrospora elynae]
MLFSFLFLSLSLSFFLLLSLLAGLLHCLVYMPSHTNRSIKDTQIPVRPRPS